MNILIFGDSITYGAWDRKGGWVQRLREELDERVISSNQKDYFIVYNLGISGDTSETLLKRFDSEVKARVWDEKDNVVIFAIGANDCIFENETKKFETPIENFKKNIEELIKRAKVYTNKIFFIGITPVDESKLNPIPWLPTHSSKNEFIDKYNEVLQEVVSRHKLIFVDVCQEFQQNYLDLLEDGDHPNSEGHQCIFECVKEVLESEGIVFA